jgi:UDP-N-acetylglucosamine diphosphorylase/glucosamine-1-phosphate N-acetyltransferase
MQGVKENVAVLILAAGLGTRMKSDRAKVLHDILGEPMIIYVTKTAASIAGDNVVVVVGHQAEIVRQIVSKELNTSFAFQEKQLGTGHAVMCGLPYLSEEIENVVILCGDVPLLTPGTVMALVDSHEKGKNHITVLAVEVEDPTGYGRMVVEDNQSVAKIVEEADASAEEKDIKIINSGVYCVQKEFLQYSLGEIKADNKQKELYLTDIIEVGKRDKKRVCMIMGDDPSEIIGVNSIDDLKEAEKLMKKRIGHETT